MLATIDEELTKAVLTVAKKEHNGTGQEQHREIAEGTEWKEGPACLRFPESKWPIKPDIIKDTKELEKGKIEIQKQGLEYGMPRSIKSASEKHELEHGTETNKLVWEKGWISSLQRDHEHTNVATKSGLELCCTSFKDHVSKLCNNYKNCETDSFAEKEITEREKLELVFETKFEKNLEKHKHRGKMSSYQL